MIILASLMVASGCTNPAGYPDQLLTTQPPTSEPTPLGPTVTVLPVFMPTPAVSQNYQTISLHPTSRIPPCFPVIPGPARTDYSTNVSYRHFSNPYFAIAYPSTWTVEPGSVTRFSSPDKKIEFSAAVQNFFGGGSGDFRLNPDYSWVLNRVSAEYPRLDPHNIVYDYSLTSRNSAPMATYFVKLPDGSLSYAKYVLVTVRHGYEFTLSADTADFENAAPVRNAMIDSLVIEDSA